MNKAERAYASRVVALGCRICALLQLGETPCIVHHRRIGMGKMRATHSEIYGLCPFHHTDSDHGIHGMGTKAFERAYGVTEEQLVAETKELAGYVGA